MDIKKYQLFAITAETNSISKTADLTGYTQSGVSHMLKSLEDEVNLLLLKRDRYGVHLTPEGEELLVYVRRVLAENDNLEQYVNDLHGIERGTLTIGAFTSVSIHWLPPILDLFQKDHPHISIRLKEGGIEEIEKWINNNEVNIAFYSKQPGQKFDFIHIQDDPLVAVLPKDYPINDEENFPIERFEGEPYIMSEIGVDYDIHRILDNASVNPDVRFSAKDDYAIMSMVEHHLGITILPQLIVQGRINDFITLPLNPPNSRELGIGMADLKTASPLTKKFVQFVKNYFKLKDYH